MSEGLFDLLYVIDSIITSILKVFIILIILKLIKNRKNCLKEITKWQYYQKRCKT